MHPTQKPIPAWQAVTGWALSGLLTAVFVPSAYFKIAQPAWFLEDWSKTYPAASALPIGVIELAIFALYLVPKTRYLGGLLMLAYLGGAVATHVHANDGGWFVPVVVGVVAWLGLYLRDRKLRALVPTVEE
ncbi:MAG: DoxX family protein [Gemmataceae bacterium]